MTNTEIHKFKLYSLKNYNNNFIYINKFLITFVLKIKNNNTGTKDDEKVTIIGFIENGPEIALFFIPK